MSADKFGQDEARARDAFAKAGLDQFTLRIVRGVWLATFYAASIAYTKRAGRGRTIPYYAALKKDGTTTLGVTDLMRSHIELAGGAA